MANQNDDYEKINGLFEALKAYCDETLGPIDKSKGPHSEVVYLAPGHEDWEPPADSAYKTVKTTYYYPDGRVVVDDMDSEVTETSEVSDSSAETLREIYSTNNINALSRLIDCYPDVWKDERKMNALLLDFFPDNKLVRNLLYACVEEGITEVIAADPECDNLHRLRCAKMLVAGYGCSIDIAKDIIKLWISAFE